ncbi:hypothetical protein [Streptomyces sp. RKAG290]|uniref:hypothetical protein n=1 Tax=Streptomyces sp. RKAG290 TaxID=2888348 RepID=UPI0020345A4A|nr:hypothetical protein [Streptomyces sp. RKAG290]MCM2414490.1 hypothetical protein [Streptomyces sp. RKAG290]
MSGTRGARYGRLLLFATLLFGIFTMHTVGHPAEQGRTGTALTGSHAMNAPPAPVDAADDPAAGSMASDAMTAVDAVAGDATALAATAAGPMAPAAMTAAGIAPPPDAGRPGRPAPMQGMDPMAVCLAVLSAWAVALLTVLLVARRTADRPAAGAGARSPQMPRPPPPPRPRNAVLIGLSVLRI